MDLSESVDDHMKDNTNEKVIGIFSWKRNFIPIVDFIALDLKCYSFNHLTIDVVNRMRIRRH